MASKSITELTKRAEAGDRITASRKNEKAKDKLNYEKMAGFGTAFAASIVAGFVDGRFDLSDEKSGDGTKVMGVPVVPVAAGIIAVGGIAMGGKGGSLLAYAGLGAACGWGYGAAADKGLEGDIKRRQKAGVEDFQ